MLENVQVLGDRVEIIVDTCMSVSDSDPHMSVQQASGIPLTAHLDVSAVESCFSVAAREPLSGENRGVIGKMAPLQL
jgi:hypothetical protein